MVELLFVACMATSPQICRERSLLFTDISPMTCLMAAQPELAKWTESNPKWTISSWKCQNLRTAERDA